MKKKILGIGLACLIAGALLAGCGASSSQPTENTTTAIETTTTATDTTTTTEAETTTKQETTTITETPTSTETTIASSPEDAYEGLLNKYKEIVKDGSDYYGDKLIAGETQLPDYIDGSSIYDNFPVSYSLVDIDGNGISELMIWGKYGLQAAYTTVDKEITPLIFSSYRAAQIEVGDDFVFYVHRSSGAFDGGYSIFKMSNDGKSLVLTEEYEYSEREPQSFIKYENVGGDFFNSSTRERNSGIPISKEEIDAVTNAYLTAYYSGERQYF